ncbi:chromosome segregation protein SMC [Aliiglaciecola sp. 2_MG-2023]|uniref:chromosome segregation protein SMC n=1 Tax=unclassified Aliiglaciecola TaxID=2593648 RepID=UPI0026E2F2BA|nr:MULTISPECIES: chromosome segregation protein SMC [unclassified Aliiglaciecola]MDO6711804.1 chromosome segregation protein SMC [Aliiglaciecola sp. 2_MG-2023]MDO6753022.1 chromosome segregation protein SMC [Aliiglaciecola sp. 1_MG-2023]
MRLKKIRLAGFKSFVDPTNIPFPDDMTAIVGPNGCGKSNVIDAVRWVLGESSAKNLRGDAMTDVIFNGSSARKPVSQCSVELVFDNSSGRIQGEFANYTELSVKRIVTREAQSTYYLNASKCRRRDVTDLFLGTGLGPRSYAIIEQGTISRLIESKPQELRVFIEEAAGISKYKERRRETENRIRHTKENLERLEDVRAELGQQIDKLQRQASAARKYKDLKAKERTLKGELAALRWLKHSEHIAGLESEIEQQQNEVEAFVAKQRGDERGITVYREQQHNLKQQLTDLQKENFRLGTDITKLEQNRLHAKQRALQIENELQEINQSIEESELIAAEEAAKLESLEMQVAESEPESEALQAQLENAQDTLLQHQEKLRWLDNDFRDHEKTYQNTKQQAQSCHSQIQSTMNMQMRTQQRIGELQQEQNELQQDVLAEQITSLQTQVEQAKEDFEDAKQQLHSIKETLLNAREKEKSQQHQLFELKGQVQQFDAQISALNSLQSLSDEDNSLELQLQSSAEQFQPLWQVLQVEAGWEKAVEAVTREWQQAFWLSHSGNIQDYLESQNGKLIFADQLEQLKPEGTLASKISNPDIPDWFCQVLTVETAEQALALQQTLKSGQSIVSKQGQRFGKGWLDLGDPQNQGGMIERAAKITELTATRQQLIDDKLLQLEDSVSQMAQASEHLELKIEESQANFKQAEQTLIQRQNQLNLIEMQQQQTALRQTKLSEELGRQLQLLEDEKMQSEQLAEQVQELEVELEDMSAKQLDFEQQKSRLLEHEQQARHQVEALTSQSHQLALSLQQLKSQFQGVSEANRRTKQLLENLQNRHSMLSAELTELSKPFDEQQQTLAALLEQRVEVEIQQTEISDQLAEVENLLSDAEKGQQGIVEKIQQMRSQLESKKLECEGYRVRANSTLENLDELNQSLKSILETLPEEAEETQWQQQLETTLAAVSRLGAVNLAAVEEYEIQFERKKHLDDQNNDLVAALETLESAIRKIDRETRTRFKETFDKVNDGLKELFPKVFGGGSAYLELTGEDLLETGVTIMARPPGKKNSTIHLLSGGEKALTALSLVFAIFRLNPAPFCLLDEVDAPLDDANVGRFCKLVSEMSKSVQFIYITHNKIAMEMAKHLTGVTMAEPGVSRMVAVDVEEAVAIAQA